MNDAPDTDRFRRTRPWARDEYLYVDGQPCVYTLHRADGEMQVHLPGRRTTTLPELRAAKVPVTFPTRYRFHGDD